MTEIATAEAIRIKLQTIASISCIVMLPLGGWGLLTLHEISKDVAVVQTIIPRFERLSQRHSELDRENRDMRNMLIAIERDLDHISGD